MILNKFYNQSPAATTKLLIQILAILIFADFIWFFFFGSAWSHDLIKAEDLTLDIIEFWTSLSFMHGFVYFISVVELIVKIILFIYLFLTYKGKYSWKDLLTLNYDGLTKYHPEGNKSEANEDIENLEPNEKQNKENNNEINPGISYQDSFHNNY